MKKKLLSQRIFIALAFSALAFAGCSKTGGAKSGSTPTTSTMVYANDALTPITITVNGSTSTIPVGGSASFTDSAGTRIVGVASTSGLTASNGVVGVVINWTLDGAFPASGTSTQKLDVSAQYFFLKIANTSSYAVSGVYVNYGLVAQTFDNISFGSGTFNIGYYPAFTNSNVRCQSPSGGYWQGNITLANAANQSFLYTLTN